MVREDEDRPPATVVGSRHPQDSVVAQHGRKPPRRKVRDPRVGREAAAVEDLAPVVAGRLVLVAHRSMLGAGYERMRKDSWTSAPFPQVRDRRKMSFRVMVADEAETADICRGLHEGMMPDARRLAALQSPSSMTPCLNSRTETRDELH